MEMNKILSILLTLLLFASCSQEELGTPFYAGQEVSISAALSSSKNNDGKKRISGKDNVDRIDLTWDEGDKILVTVGDKSAVFTLSSGAGTNNATFTGTMPADGNTFHVTYPVNYTDDVLSHQTYTADGFGKGLMKMSTKIPGTLDKGFTLSADNALLGLKLQGDANVSKIVLTQKDNDDNAENNKTYSLDCSTQVVNTADGALFYIVVPAGVWANGLKVEVYNGNGIVIEERIKTSAAEFVAGQALMMPQVEISEPTCGKRIGIFTVSDDKKVSFSQGNLQYTQSTNTWQFAKNQWEYIGADNVKDGVLADKIDLFGWSGENSNAPFGLNTSTNSNDYTGEFVDWGYKIISGDVANTWRTLSNEEWEYLFEKRTNASILYGVARVADVNGLIILPDNWIAPNGITFKTGLHTVEVKDYSVFQSFTQDQWLLMEQVGAVFFPAAGYRDGLIVEKFETSGYYWSNTSNDEDTAYRMYFYSYFLGPKKTHSKYRGRSVRLVHDTIVHDYVDLGLSVKWATCNVGATTPEEYGDLFAWGETEPKEIYGWNTYKWCDDGANMTKYNATDGLTTLLPEDDAAHVHWGGQWRMPSDVEMSELISDCTWELITKNGVKGYQITSKVEGYLDQSIFWPCAGYLNHDLNNIVNASARYWTNKCNGSKACNLYEFETIMYNTRRCGCSIRPVLPKN